MYRSIITTLAQIRTKHLQHQYEYTCQWHSDFLQISLVTNYVYRFNFVFNSTFDKIASVT